MISSGREDNCIFLIGSDFRITFADKKLTELFPGAKAGSLCYEALCGGSAPCENCPVVNGVSGDAASRCLCRDGAVLTEKITRLEGDGGCGYMVSLRQSHISNRSRAFKDFLTDRCEEIYQADISTGSVEQIHISERLAPFAITDAPLGEQLKLFAEEVVHPDDREFFLHEWSRKTERDTIGRTEKMSFRRRLANGEYGVENQQLVEFTDEESGNRSIICFCTSASGAEASSAEGQNYNSLTRLLRKESFTEAVSKLLEKDERDFFIAYIDIEHFKLYNDWYGFKEGDRLLCNLGGFAGEQARKEGGVAGYFGADDFVLLLPEENDGAARLVSDLWKWVEENRLEVNFSPSVGLYKVSDRTVPVELMCDLAQMAMSGIKGDYLTRYMWYNSEMRRKFEDEQMLLLEAKKAIEQRQFKVYFQPKCNMVDGRIVGNEALVRWIHPEKGMISPARFIPLLEKTGFIYNLDEYVWEDVCRYQRNIIDRDMTPLPVSVNVSRTDIYKNDIPAVFSGLVEKYGLSPDLIEIEITESAYISDYDKLGAVVKELRRRGFHVLMDDFGSGYSSLNALKDLEVDIIKIDMKFLEASEGTKHKSDSILESVIRMAKWLGYRVIAEGTETKEQVDMLLKLGCHYAQGYYYYKPMPCEDYEKLIEDDGLLDHDGIRRIELHDVGLTELFHEDVISEGMLSNIMGGVGLYTQEDGVVTLLRANRQYYETTGRDPENISEIPITLVDNVLPEDVPLFLENLHKAEKGGNEGAACTIRMKRDVDSEIMWAHYRLFFLRKSGNTKYFYATVSDVTAEKKGEQELRESQQQLASALGAIQENGTLKRLRDSNRAAAINVFAELTPGGMCGGYLDKDFPIYYANDGMARLAGYDSYDEMYEAIDGKLINTVAQEDHDKVRNAMTRHGGIYEGMEYEVKYNLVCKDDSRKRVVNAGRIIRAEDGRLAAVSVTYDISDIANAEAAARGAMQKLEQSNRELSILINNLPVGYYKMTYCSDPVICYCSRKFLELAECTEEELRDVYNNRFINLVHPDDRKILEQNFFSGEMESMQFRIVTKRGEKVVYGSANLVREEDGKSYAYCLMQDVTENVRLRHRYKMVLANTPGDVFRASAEEMEFFAYNRGEGLGYTYDEYKRKVCVNNGSEITYPGDRETVRKVFAEAFANKTDFSVLFRSVKKDGSLCWTRMNANCEIENGEPVFYGILQDVDQMVIARNGVKAILDCVAGNIVRIYLDEKGFFAEVEGGSLGASLGYDSNESCAEALKQKGYGFYAPEDLPVLQELCSKRFKDHEPVDLKVRCLRADGGYETVWCKASYSFTNGSGQAVYDGALILVDNKKSD